MRVTGVVKSQPQLEPFRVPRRFEDALKQIPVGKVGDYPSIYPDPVNPVLLPDCEQTCSLPFDYGDVFNRLHPGTNNEVCLAVRRDEFLVVVLANNTIHLFEHESLVSSVSFDSVFRWDYSPSPQKGLFNPIHCIDFDPLTKTLAIGSQDRPVLFMKYNHVYAPYKVNMVESFYGSKGDAILFLRFLDSETLATFYRSGAIEVLKDTYSWKHLGGQLLCKKVNRVACHGSVIPIQFALECEDSDAKYMFAFRFDRLNETSVDFARIPNESVESLAFSVDGSEIVVRYLSGYSVCCSDFIHQFVKG